MFNYYEEKWYITLLKWLGLMLLIFICFIILVLIISCFPQTQYHYEYIDLDNNKGIAKECSYKFEQMAYKVGE